jgi:CubicO group peptidase (beta-lactamase class C family)
MTKPITSAALLTLYEAGAFHLTDPLERHIPELRDLRVYAGMDGDRMRLEPPRRKPTVHDVFRHTAGFGYAFDTTPADDAYRKHGIDFGKLASLEELVTRKLPQVPLLYHPGERWVYSVSHDVQAFLVERLSGLPFERYCRERIFEPLGMTDTVFGIPPSLVERFTANYAPRDPANPAAGLAQVETREGVPPPGAPPGMLGNYGRFTRIPFGGLSLSSTAMDYARFAQMLLNEGELDGARLLGRKTVELMTSNHLPESIPGIGTGPGALDTATGYGLGVSVLLDPARSGYMGSVGNFGWAGAATTWVVIDPVEDLVLIVMTQYMMNDVDFAARFQTLAYQALVD